MSLRVVGARAEIKIFARATGRFRPVADMISMADSLRMRYASGHQVLIGDEVGLGKLRGVVAALLGEAVYRPPLRSEEWAYLKYGMLVDFSDNRLIHYIEAEPDLVLLKRASNF